MKGFLLAVLLLTQAPAAIAGLVNDIVVLDSPTLLLVTIDWVGAGMGVNTLGGATLVPLGGADFRIDVMNRHLVGPHGELVPGPQLQVALSPVTLGGAGGPERTSGAHGVHFDVLQALLESTAANSSRLYIRFDHAADQTTVPTIDPSQFMPQPGSVPEPGSLALCAAALAALCMRRRIRRWN